MHRYLLAALAALLAYTLEVKAADPGTRAKIIAPVQAVADEPVQWNRTGFYVAAIGAYDVKVFQAEDWGEAAAGKLMGGGALGWNWRAAPNFVLGVEVDWMFTGIKASTSGDAVGLSASTNHLVSARGRAGVPLGPALVYVTAGPAWQQIKVTDAGGDIPISDSSWQLGVAAGGGVELELSRGLAMRLEALHYAFWDNGAPLTELFKSENQHTTARAGIVFKLN